MGMRILTVSSRRPRCATGKLRYTATEARLAVRALAEKGYDASVFVCRHCGWHHTTTQVYLKGARR